VHENPTTCRVLKLVSAFINVNGRDRIVSLRGVVVDLSGLRDRGPRFKTRSRPLTFMKADTNFRTLHVVGFSCTNEFYLWINWIVDRLISQGGIKWTLNEFLTFRKPVFQCNLIKHSFWIREIKEINSFLIFNTKRRKPCFTFLIEWAVKLRIWGWNFGGGLLEQ
jgi:hypothetical protein